MSKPKDPFSSAKSPNYGIDAPEVVRRFTLLGLAGLLLGALLLLFLRRTISPVLAASLGAAALGTGCVFLANAAVMVWGSKIGKLRLRDKVIDALPWRGDELVLDVGCGHGLMLIGAAKRLRRGKAIGIDLWQREDQAGNSRQATWRNVELEGVTDRVELKDGDARKLPFADGTFDVVLSSWALHNIYDRAGRETAVQEIARVLKAGGRLVLIDIRHTKEYAEVLRANAMRELKVGRPNLIFVIPSYTLTATKPG